MIRSERRFQRLGGRGSIGFGNVEQQAVGKHADRCRDGKRAGRQGLAIDGEAMKPPGREGEARQPKLEQVLQEAVLQLQVLRGEQDTLRPEDWLHLPHGGLT